MMRRRAVIVDEDDDDSTANGVVESDGAAPTPPATERKRPFSQAGGLSDSPAAVRKRRRIRIHNVRREMESLQHDQVASLFVSLVRKPDGSPGFLTVIRHGAGRDTDPMLEQSFTSALKAVIPHRVNQRKFVWHRHFSVYDFLGCLLAHDNGGRQSMETMYKRRAYRVRREKRDEDPPDKEKASSGEEDDGKKESSSSSSSEEEEEDDDEETSSSSSEEDDDDEEADSKRVTSDDDRRSSSDSTPVSEEKDTDDTTSDDDDDE